MAYTPSETYIDRYADLLVNFALGKQGKEGIKKGETVYLIGSESTKPLFMACRRKIFAAGGNVIMQYLPDGCDRGGYDRDFFVCAKGQQLDFFPKSLMKGLVDDVDHMLYIVGEADPHAMSDVDPKKIMRKATANKPFMQWRMQKEQRGEFSWTIALFGTPAMAKEAGLSEKAYWNQIIKACYLDDENPKKQWREMMRKNAQFKQKLDEITQRTRKFHVEGPDVDLWITPGKHRQWIYSDGQNIPSFEVFTSPDWRGTEGWIRFNQPLYRYGSLVTGIELQFKNGRVVKSTAEQNQKLLRDMIKTENADKVGEFSLTDKRLSRITKFMAETLYDENIGGLQGNTHIALGKAFPDTYAGDQAKLSDKKKEQLGFNESVIHTDIISTARRTVTAHLTDGTEQVIYQDGQFVL